MMGSYFIIGENINIFYKRNVNDLYEGSKGQSTKQETVR